MTDIEIVNNYAIERENLTLQYLLFVVDSYAHEPEKIKELIQERIDKNNTDLVK